MNSAGMRAVLLAVSGLFWAVMMALLFEEEVVPYFEYQAAPTYRALLKEKPSRELIVRRIIMGSETIGQARTVFIPAPEGGRLIRTDLSLSLSGILKMMGWQDKFGLATEQVSLVSQQRLNAAFRLESFSTTGRILVPVSAFGRRDGDVMRISYAIDHTKGGLEVPMDKTAMMAAEMSPTVGFGRPVAGKRWKFSSMTFDIFSRKVEFTTIYARIMDREDLELPGRDRVGAYRVEFRKDPTKELADSWLWVDEDGEVLREEMKILGLPTSIILVEKKKLSPEEAARFLERR